MPLVAAASTSLSSPAIFRGLIVGHFAGERFQESSTASSPVMDTATGLPFPSTMSEFDGAEIKRLPSSRTDTTGDRLRTLVVHRPFCRALVRA